MSPLTVLSSGLIAGRVKGGTIGGFCLCYPRLGSGSRLCLACFSSKFSRPYRSLGLRAPNQNSSGNADEGDESRRDGTYSLEIYNC
ncbi:hypothetical protein [Streptomyces sp. I05A-00742]|uniref:hypothetical protein n=1 Tax=Streptomyces sp. I05A-00742 TaxID=2732853 RepID=UPI001487F8D8|nr:hypothetical protein [Streptomyces sp. I05A-00742]